jgi:hypothetical protein
MSAPRISYEIIQLRPNQLILYTYVEQTHRSKKQLSSKIHNWEKEGSTYTGLLTTTARNKLKLAINLLVAQSKWKEATNYELNRTFKFRVNCVTLTMSAPQGSISDKEIKNKCLGNFLERAKKKWGMDTYVWRAEKQKNTNIHFHITTDVFIHYADLCRTWNECQELLGFVTNFRERTGSYQPNSTDVHSIKDVKNLAAYLVKYMSKGEKDAQTIDGKVWGCSKNLLKPKRYEIEAYGNAYSEFARICSSHQKQVFKTDYCTFVSLPEETFLRELPSEWRTEYDRYLASVKNPSLIPETVGIEKVPPAKAHVANDTKKVGNVGFSTSNNGVQLDLGLVNHCIRPDF